MDRIITVPINWVPIEDRLPCDAEEYQEFLCLMAHYSGGRYRGHSITTCKWIPKFRKKDNGFHDQVTHWAEDAPRIEYTVPEGIKFDHSWKG